MQIKATTGLNRTVKNPCNRQPLDQGDVERLASSCYQLCNGEAIGHPWCSQLDVYTSTCLDMFELVLYSEVPTSCALLGVLA